MSEYYIIKDEIQVGPYTVEQLRMMLSSGAIAGDTPVKASGAGDDGRFTKAADLLDAQNASAANSSGCRTAELLSIEDGIMRVACPVCGQHYSVTNEFHDGQRCKCFQCDREFLLPDRPGRNAGRGDYDSDIPDGDLLCPHCWKSFDADHVLYISVHPSLSGDPVLGEYEQKRFVPTVFNQAGQPLDECGLPALEMACPRCHLYIPTGLVDLDTPSLYFSIVGAVSSGKSYFLTCLTHLLRKTLPEYFGAAFFDVDPRLNETLNAYEKQLFMALSPDKVTTLPATQISGDGISDRVKLGGIEVELPQPFIFEFRSKDGVDDLNMVFYDNSGEMFTPGRDSWVNQATFHLSHSDGIMFLFDPTSDASMRLSVCDERDPQVSQRPRVVDQTLLLNEMISRIRRHANMPSSDTCKIPLVVAVVKYDTWRGKFDRDLDKIPFVVEKEPDERGSWGLSRDNIFDVSFALREMLLQYVPGLVNAAESFFESVTFVPVSNFGTVAEQNDSGVIGIVPQKLSPIWVEVPFLTLLSQHHDLLPVKVERNPGANDGGFEVRPLGKIVGGRIEFPHPVTRKLVRLPGNYAGALIRTGGKAFRLPSLPGSGRPRQKPEGHFHV